MTCNECLSIIEELVEDSLAPQTSNQVKAHVAACEACRIIYEELKNELEVYSRYLLKINEKPESWTAVQAEIRKGNSNVAGASAGTIGAWFYQRLSHVFYRQPLYGTMVVLVLVIGIGFGLWYRNYVREDLSLADLTSSGSRENELTLNGKDNDLIYSDSFKTKDVKVKPAKNEPQILNEGKSLSGKNIFAAYPIRSSNEKKLAKSMHNDFAVHKIKEAPVSFDSSESAFNRHIEKCEMVLRSFRNAVLEKDESDFDISYEKRLSKDLLNSNLRFRREAQSQGNLPVEKLLTGLEAVLRDITRLPERANLSDTKLVKGRIQESGIIAKLQVESVLVRSSD